ncbi:hypothetical protein BCR24_15000 [Enterococcus ureilyticus]|uniref:DUF421 domain-containing protein n=1 Tax=Enterococcus ureilyticus TaxID=1131292 RepID=A0A1E5HCG8_9ENTE|nr:YetF domain-containing protein [Enterococcus ureilyticus]MBM7690421.1 uncharacterized membrane protein YcaP (DUF421 family) [Enterococcus ureilyticus]OEG22515.1 hypothetical protein BCR24_15000 [Enterococcus ureilyticus]
MDYIVVFQKLFIGYIAIVFYFHIVGRAAMAPVTPSDQIQNFFLGGMAGAVILNFTIQPIQFIFIIFIWFSIIVSVNFLKLRLTWLRDLVEGNSIELFSNNQPNKKGFFKAKLTAGDFVALLRNNGVTSIDHLKNVRIESNGQLAISLRGDDSFSKYLVIDGQINQTELSEVGKNIDWLLDYVETKKLVIEEIFLLEFNKKTEDVLIIKMDESEVTNITSFR